jgi:hypothetical protein
MMPNLLKNYIFQSQIGPNFGIKSINEDLLTRLDTSSPSHTVSCKSKFCDSDISYAIVNVNGCVALYTPGGTGIVTLYPWNYDTPNFYSDKNVSDQINLGKRLKKCGVWVGNTQSGTYIKWRFLASNISIVQYEFDCMIYESGVIEWGYSSFNSITTTKNYFNYSESGTANCYVIGYDDGHSSPSTTIEVCDPSIKNQNSKFGGLRQTGGIAIPVNINNTSWPGKTDFGALYRFVPPPEHTKKILPRLELRNQDNNSPIFENGLFDDRKSLAFIEQVVNMPTQLPRLFGQLSTFDNPEVSLYTDLELQGEIRKSAVDPWIPKDPQLISSFSETQNFEQDIKDTEFYKTGSKVEDVGLGFDGNLGQKTTIKYELPIAAPHIFPATTATLSYYDFYTHSFKKAGYDQDPKTSLAVFGDARLYTAFGTQVASGNVGISTIHNSQVTTSTSPFLLPHPWVQGDLTPQNINDAYQYVLLENANLNLSFSFDYNSVEPIIFSNENSAPFLVEKVIVELPFAAGPGWFNDRTVARKINRCNGVEDRCLPDAGTQQVSWSYDSGTHVYTLYTDAPSSKTYTLTLVSGTTYAMGGDGSGTFDFSPTSYDAGTFTENGGSGRTITLTVTNLESEFPTHHFTITCEDICIPPPPDECVPESGRFSRAISSGIKTYKFYTTGPGGGLSLILTQDGIASTTFNSSDDSTFTFDESTIFTENGGLNRTLTISSDGLVGTYNITCEPTPPEECVESSGTYEVSNNDLLFLLPKIYTLTNSDPMGPSYVLTQDSPYSSSLNYVLSGDSTGVFVFDGSNTFTETGGLERTITLGAMAPTYSVSCPQPPACIESSGHYIKTGTGSTGYVYTLTNDAVGPSYTLSQDSPFVGTLTYTLISSSTDNGHFTFDNVDTFTETGGFGRTIVIEITTNPNKIYTVSCPVRMGFGVGSRTTKLTNFLKGIIMSADAPTDLCDAIDVGGPCVTFGLIKENRNKYLDNFSFTGQRHYDFSHREVILSGTIIPIGDNTKSYDIVRSNPISQDSQLILSGFNAYSGNPTAVVAPGIDGKFTGSVRLNMTAQSSNVLYYSYGNNKSVVNVPTNSNPKAAYGFGKEWLNLFKDTEFSELQNFKPYNVSGLNRISDTRSIFGKTYDTYNSPTINGEKGFNVKNPWYEFQNSISDSIDSWLSTYPTDNIHVEHVGMATQFNNNPYLLLPGDRLSFFISKYRPVKKGFYSDSYSRLAGECWPYYSNHDVQIPTGSLKVTIYGSYVSKGNERHEPTPESLYTTQLNKVIGDDPVLDQWELWDDRELIGTFYDDVSVPWNIFNFNSRDDKPSFTYNQKRRVTGLSYGVNHAPLEPNESGQTQILLSKTDPKNGYYSRDYVFGMNTYFSLLASDYHIQNYEIMGSSKVSPKQRHVCESEIIFDSLAPSIYKFLETDGVHPTITSEFSDTGLYVLSNWNVGFSGSRTNSDYYSSFRAFPFESRYVNVPRVFEETSYVAYTGSLTPTEIFLGKKVKTKDVKSISFEIVESYETSVTNIGRRKLLADYQFYTFPTIPLGSLTNPKKQDISKFFFGFGDTLSASFDTNMTALTSLVGMPTFRHTDASVLNSSNLDFVTSPLIRGWKYGLYSGISSNTSCIFRRGRFGQNRDMLEQRFFTICKKPLRGAALDGPISVKFVQQTTSGTFLIKDPTTIGASNMLSLNLSPFVTSSLPYFDEESRE